MKELKYYKNEMQEIVFENLDEIKEDSELLLKLKNGDIFVLFYAIEYLPIGTTLYIPYISNISQELRKLLVYYLDKFSIFIIFFDKLQIAGKFNNILPAWNIPKDNAILFLDFAEQDKYDNIYKNKDYLCQENFSEFWDDHQFNKYNKISIITQNLTSKNIQEINNIAKELKETYGVEEVNLFVSHCFAEEYKNFYSKYDNDLIYDYEHANIIINRLNNFAQYNLNEKKVFENLTIDDKDCYIGLNEYGTTLVIYKRDNYGRLININLKNKSDLELNKYSNINKITTTNSTGMLEVKKSNRFEVIDCVEFFQSN